MLKNIPNLLKDKFTNLKSQLIQASKNKENQTQTHHTLIAEEQSILTEGKMSQ